MIPSTLGWRAGRAGVLHPVVESSAALPRTIHHGDVAIVFGARSDLRGVVDLTDTPSVSAAAFAGPLLRFQGSGGDSGGFNLRGTSSSGKTTALRAAASVYGGTGYVCQWRATANGLEAIAEAHSDCLLILDELAQIDASEAGECAYLLGNGTGKNRMAKSLSAPPPKEWRLLFLSAGEISLSEHMLEAGKHAKAGQELRLADLPADAGAGMGIIETLHGHADSGAIANHIRDATARHHGHAGTAWLDGIVAHDRLSARVGASLKRWMADTSALCPAARQPAPSRASGPSRPPANWPPKPASPAGPRAKRGAPASTAPAPGGAHGQSLRQHRPGAAWPWISIARALD